MTPGPDERGWLGREELQGLRKGLPQDGALALIFAQAEAAWRLDAENRRLRAALEESLYYLEDRGHPNWHHRIGADCGEGPCTVCLVEGTLRAALADLAEGA